MNRTQIQNMAEAKIERFAESTESEFIGIKSFFYRLGANIASNGTSTKVIDQASKKTVLLHECGQTSYTDASEEFFDTVAKRAERLE